MTAAAATESDGSTKEAADWMVPMAGLGGS